ncbi:MAG: Franean1_4349 family RiPP [Anaerolineales bacterium]|nr:MAG: Franean1_4349 family RiPP [Anaerolineales bacterium]
MAPDTVALIIGRAVTDEEFRALLLSDPDQALQGYDLSADEVEAINNLKQEDLEDFSTKLDSRITKRRLWRG